MIDIVYKDESYKIQGVIFQVYKKLGCGFLEAVYQECMELEFRKNSIPFKSQYNIDISYDGNILVQKYKADFYCYDKILVEIKAVKELSEIHTAQLINYLKATKVSLGLLVNFGSFPKADIKRYVL